MKKWIVPLMLGFGVALALIVGERMSTDAMAVVIGVAVGVAASVPTSVLLVALLRRERRPYQAEQMPPPPPPYPQMQQPQVIVLNPGMLAQGGNQGYLPLPPADFGQEAGLNRLRVVGDASDWED
jgi:hypothetical protein